MRNVYELTPQLPIYCFRQAEHKSFLEQIKAFITTVIIIPFGLLFPCVTNNKIKVMPSSWLIYTLIKLPTCEQNKKDQGKNSSLLSCDF